jgi:flagellar hook assembly protein FlgD
VLSIFVYNIHGKRIARLMDNNVITSSELLLEWDGNNEDGSPVSGGMYYISINRNGQLSNHRVVKQ